MGTKKAVRSFASCISITAILFGIVGGLVFPQSAYAASFDCAGSFYMSRDPGDGTGTQLYKMNRSQSVSVAFSDLVGSPQGLTLGGQPFQTADPGAGINALAYNPVDNYFYAVRTTSSGTNVATIYRINSDGSLEVVGTLDTTNIGDDEVWGATFDAAGNMYVKSHYTGMEVVHGLATAPTVPFTQTSLTLSIAVHMGDLAWDFSTSMMYAIDGSTEEVYRIDPTTGTTTLVTQSGINSTWPAPTTGPGSLFIDANNNLYSYENGTGKFFQIDKTSGKFTLLEQGAAAAQTDGASCVPVNNTIDVVKSAGIVAASSATQFTVPYTVTVGNKGLVTDPNVQLIDDLDVTFAQGSPTKTVSGLQVVAGSCSVNSSYNGTTDKRLLTGTDSLTPGGSCTLQFSVGLVYSSSSQVPTGSQLNTVLASTAATANGGHYYSGSSTLPPANVIATDSSTDNAGLPSASNGDAPTPTPVLLSYTAPVVSPTPQSPSAPVAAALAQTGQPVFVAGGVALGAIAIGVVTSLRRH